MVEIWSTPQSYKGQQPLCETFALPLYAALYYSVTIYGPGSNGVYGKQNTTSGLDYRLQTLQMLQQIATAAKWAFHKGYLTRVLLARNSLAMSRWS